MRRSEEFAAKLERLDEFLAEQELGGVVLSRSENFAWLGCGADNSVVTSSATGVAALVARPGCVTLVANNIEAERMLAEELDDLDITETEVFPWHRPTEREEAIARLSTGARLAADDGSAGLPPLPEEFARLRYVLTGAEIDRYQQLGQDCTEAMEAAARSVRQGMTEAEAAGLLAGALRERAVTPVVLLVAADERIQNWRHPVPKSAAVQRCAMLVTCGRRNGLVAAITRLVHFGEPDDTLKERHRAVCDVDAAMILATVPERPVTDVLSAAREAYAANGFPDEWKLHHQGGATGYQPREYLVNPDTVETVHADQAFGWNPSITGTKSEDTILAGEEGVAFITAPTADWPTLATERDGTTIERADILVK